MMCSTSGNRCAASGSFWRTSGISWLSTVTVLVSLLLTSCQPTLKLPDPRSCHPSRAMVMPVVGECVIYQAILREAASAVEGNQRPVAVRLNQVTVDSLRAEVGSLLETRKLMAGGKLSVLETPHGPMLLVLDRHMPDDCVIVLCAIPVRTVFPKGDEDA